MMVVRTHPNQYPGINAHLHSQWQSEGGWDEFHASHIVYLAAALKAQLHPMGYTAGIEQSLQIRRYDSIAEPTELLLVSASNSPVSYETEIEQYRAIGLYQFEPGQDGRGEPVAWIELLSPSNKPGGRDAAYYQDKRLKLLQTGVVFIEMDYLHESPPTFETLPGYLLKGNAPRPYRIIVIDPRPTFLDGMAQVYPFGVDDVISVVDIPLNAGDHLLFDFNKPYQRTFEEQLYGDLVDYSQLPVNFSRYGESDQSRIVARMLAVLNASRDGKDLSNPPLPVEAVSLEDGLQALAQFNTN